jgi:hypothetical protein
MFNIIVSGKKNDQTMGIFPYWNKNTSTFVNRWIKNIEFLELFNFTPLKKVKPNSKYIIYVNVYENFFNKKFERLYDFQINGKSKLIIPDRIIQDSQKGLVHWLIDYSTECDQLCYDHNIVFSKLCKTLQATPNNITLITGAETQGKIGEKTKNSAIKYGYNVITGYDLFGFLQLDEKKIEHDRYSTEKIRNILNCKKLKFKSLCYNRLPRYHRTVIVAHIMKNQYSDKCLYSLGTYLNGSREQDTEHFPKLSKQIKALKNGPNIYPHITEKNVNLHYNQAHALGWEHGLNSYFQFVTETTPFTDRFPFITEKSLKPFAMLQPFIQYGPQHNVKNLQTYGFDIFEKWIDHSYDNEEDDIKRLRLVLKEFDRLQNTSDERWAEMLKEMAPSLLHNLQLVKKPPIRNLSSQLIPILYNFIKETPIN